MSLKNATDKLCDRDGTEIKVGDVVEFYYGADYYENGTWSPVETEDAPTRMVDFVVETKRGLMFICPGYGGSFAWRANKVCKIIGRLPEDRKLFPGASDAELDLKNYT